MSYLDIKTFWLYFELIGTVNLWFLWVYSNDKHHKKQQSWFWHILKWKIVTITHSLYFVENRVEIQQMTMCIAGLKIDISYADICTKIYILLVKYLLIICILVVRWFAHSGNWLSISDIKFSKLSKKTLYKCCIKYWFSELLFQ